MSNVTIIFWGGRGGGGGVQFRYKTRQCFIWSLIQSYVYRLYPNNLKL